MRTLPFVVFTAGAVTLGMEVSAARLLEPVFGNSQIVWAALIGLILLYLALGAWLGGWLADRYPYRQGLDLTLTTAALGVALVPWLSQPMLRLAAGATTTLSAGLLGGSLLAVLLLFSLPGILLGTTTPWAIRLALADVRRSGHVAGRYSALATAGSLVGTFLPVLWLIPTFGTRSTFTLLALALLSVLAAGSLRRRWRWLPLAALLLVLLAALSSPSSGRIRSGWEGTGGGQLLYEDETLYNYIAVQQWGSERHLKLNDGVGIHSVYHPETTLSQGIWDYFLLAPLWRGSDGGEWRPRNLLLIGLAAGTVSSLYTKVYGPLPITGVELDPGILAVGRSYFELDTANLTAVAADGRAWLRQQPPDARWDVIAVDAYRPPYIPFHLATVEFFQLARDHLDTDGVLAINVGRTDTNFALVEALAATLREVFPSVHIIDEPGPTNTLANSLVVATVRPTTPADFAARADALPASLPPDVRALAQRAKAQVRTPAPSSAMPVLKDDHAPVEQIVHRIIFDYLLAGR